MPFFCEVALPLPLDRTFTYALPDGLHPRRGARVVVPFRNEKVIGVVTALSDAPPADFEARTIEALLDDEPLLSDHLLTLADWIAQYYLAPLGEVLRGMLPLTAEVRRSVLYRITDLGRDVLATSHDGDGERIGSKAGARPAKGRLPRESQDLDRRILERLADGETVQASTLRTATGATLQVLAALLRKKWIARETSAKERDARRTERVAALIPDARLPKLTENQQAILARDCRRRHWARL